MAILTSTRATERLSRKLQKAGLDECVLRTSGDAAGSYLIFRVGGHCLAGAGRTLEQAAEVVEQRVAEAERGWR